MNFWSNIYLQSGRKLLRNDKQNSKGVDYVINSLHIFIFYVYFRFLILTLF